jgi:hypothetical protein
MATFTGRPAVSGDDGYTTAPATFDNNDDYTVVGQAGGAVNHSFFRIPNVGIRKGEKINSAKLTCKAYNAQVGTTTYFNIYMNDHDDAVAPTSYAEFASLDLTTAFSAWDSEEVWVENSTYDSPDFADAVQEVVDRPGWASGNAMMVLVKDDGSDNNAIRAPDSQDLGETTAVLLTIEYGLVPTVISTVLTLFAPSVETYDTRFKLRARKRDTALTTRVRNE